MSDDERPLTYAERGIVEGVRVVVTETCEPTGWQRAAKVGEVGTIFAVLPHGRYTALQLDINNRIVWAGDVELCPTS